MYLFVYMFWCLQLKTIHCSFLRSILPHYIGRAWFLLGRYSTLMTASLTFFLSHFRWKVFLALYSLEPRLIVWFYPPARMQSSQRLSSGSWVGGVDPTECYGDIVKNFVILKPNINMWKVILLMKNMHLACLPLIGGQIAYCISR